MYAQSSKKPREALWKTWCAMAQAWHFPPVPLTEELIVKVGAPFKAGHYKSPQNYFSRAFQEHRALTKQHPSPFIQSVIKNTIRSITRGSGPTPFKGSFEVELFNRAINPNDLNPDPSFWLEDPSRARDATLICCCWWLLRGIEAAAATTLHVWNQKTQDELTPAYARLQGTSEPFAPAMRWVDTSLLYADGFPTRSTFQWACHLSQDQTDTPSPSSSWSNSSVTPSNSPVYHYGTPRPSWRTTTSVLTAHLPILRRPVSH